MGKSKKQIQSREKSSYRKEPGNLPERKGDAQPKICFSLKHFDVQQGQSFVDWEHEQLLAKAVEKLRQICSLTVLQATTQQIIKPYTKVDFPPNSAFQHPKHVPDDVIWCTMHIQGKECVVGYFDDFVFHIVFFDKDHEFWPSAKR